MNEEEKEAIEYLKTRLYGNEGCKYIDVAQEDLRIFIKLVDRLQKENEELKKDYYNVINKIENKIDRFDYEFEKAKKQNNKDKSDYYWDLIRNFRKLLESEE